MNGQGHTQVFESALYRNGPKRDQSSFCLTLLFYHKDLRVITSYHTIILSCWSPKPTLLSLDESVLTRFGVFNLHLIYTTLSPTPPSFRSTTPRPFPSPSAFSTSSTTSPSSRDLSLAVRHSIPHRLSTQYNTPLPITPTPSSVNVHPVPMPPITSSSTATATAAKAHRIMLLEACAVAGVRWLISIRRVLLMLKHIWVETPNRN